MPPPLQTYPDQTELTELTECAPPTLGGGTRSVSHLFTPVLHTSLRFHPFTYVPSDSK